MIRHRRAPTARSARPLLLGCALSGLLGCGRTEPPGARPEGSAPAGVVGVAPDPGGEEPRGADGGSVVPGSIEDNLPFEPTGAKLASIAWRTWIYSDTGPKRTRYGYLRAGTLVDVRLPPIVNEGCDGGWYRINPRGFFCVGKGATKDLNHPVVLASSVRPVRGQGLPYLYGMATETPPLFYFRLPTKAEMRNVEGDNVSADVTRWRARIMVDGTKDLLGELGEPPEFLASRAPLEQPYGVAQRLHFSVHSGRAAADSGFALQRAFLWEGRAFGLSTQLDLVALDRIRLIKPSEFHGVELGPGENLPVAFVNRNFAQRFTPAADGTLHPDGSFRRREGLKLTGKTRMSGGITFRETSDGAYMVPEGERMIALRDSFPSFAVGSRNWIDISIVDQSLVAYEGQKAVYATLVSTGRGRLGDPEKVPATVRGTFMIHTKHVSTTMDAEDDVSDSYNLLDVPFVQYFHKGYAIHGTYWHDEFGQIRSHGCVNLSPIDAAWLFEWTDPAVPPEWHGVLNKDRGTVVYVRP